MRNDIATLFAALTLVSVALHLLFALLFAARSRGTIALDAPRSPRALDPDLPGVSVLKPCAGVDDDLEGCLRSFCALRYPRLEILCGVRDEDDPALAVIARVGAAHPGVAIRIVGTAQGRSVNPKVAQLEVLERAARYELLWISDSNTRVHPDTLVAMVEDLSRPGVGMVVSPVVGVGERTLGAALDNLHISSFVTLSTFALQALTGRIIAPGKSTLLRKRSLEAIGGCEELGRYCAEDYVLIERLRARGERVVIGRHAVGSVDVAADVSKFYRRHFRWTQMHWLIDRGTALEPALVPLLFAMVTLLAAPGLSALGLVALVAVVQGTVDVMVMARLRGHGLALRLLPAVLVRPLLFASFWAFSPFVRRVVWRGNVRWLGEDTLLLEERPEGLPFLRAR